MKLHALRWAEIVLASVTVLVGGYYAVAWAVDGGLQGESASGTVWLLVLTALGLAGLWLLVAGWRHDRPVVRCVGLVLVVGSPTGFAWLPNAVVLALAVWEAVALLRDPRNGVGLRGVSASPRRGPGSPAGTGGKQSV